MQRRYFGEAEDTAKKPFDADKWAPSGLGPKAEPTEWKNYIIGGGWLLFAGVVASFFIGKKKP